MKLKSIVDTTALFMVVGLVLTSGGGGSMSSSTLSRGPVFVEISSYIGDPDDVSCA